MFNSELGSAQRRWDLSGRCLQILAENAWMSSRNAEQCKRGSFWRAAVLFPIPEGVNADAHGTGETRLGQTDEASEGGDVVTGLKLAAHEASAHTGWNGPGEVAAG
jgi:hypothetical protein